MSEIRPMNPHLKELAGIIDSMPGWWQFPSEGPVLGFMGDDPVFIVGDQPSTSEWPATHPNRRAFYDILPRVGLARAHLTDLYKQRGKSGELRAGLPGDFPAHLGFFRRELSILNPNKVLALGRLAEELLAEHLPELRPILSRIWHFSYVVRAKKTAEYENNVRAALGEASSTRTALPGPMPSAPQRVIPPTLKGKITCAVQYSHPRLCFKASAIEPLSMDDSFCVLTDVGAYMMTKRDFYETFPGVRKSESYRFGKREYHYPCPPRKALRFRV